ncbi:hypothetical protein HY213_01290 [Candidatus Peregrinibacteria bacterium]|nr:hypothetical protein [Candidatus Peregrinibacteria bacterium]
MLEVLLLLIAVIILPFTGLSPPEVLFLLLLVELVCLPGTLLLFRVAPPFVPTGRTTLQAMLRLAAIREGEIVYDLGCGDGRIVFAAAALGARAIGYEFSVPTYLLAKCRSFLHPGAVIRFGDFWKQDERDADVIFCYLLIKSMPRFEREIWPRLRRGCRVVSHAFRMENIPVTREDHGAYLYVR